MSSHNAKSQYLVNNNNYNNNNDNKIYSQKNKSNKFIFLPPKNKKTYQNTQEAKQLGETLYKINKIAKQDYPQISSEKKVHLYKLKEEILNKYAKPTGEIHKVHKTKPIYSKLYKLGDETFHSEPFNLVDYTNNVFKQKYPQLSQFDNFREKREVKNLLDKRYKNKVLNYRYVPQNNRIFIEIKTQRGLQDRPVELEKLPKHLRDRIKYIDSKSEYINNIKYNLYVELKNEFEEKSVEVDIPKQSQKQPFNEKDAKVLNKVTDKLNINTKDYDYTKLIREK